MDKVTEAMSSAASELNPSILEGLGFGLEIMSTAGTTTCYIYILHELELISTAGTTIKIVFLLHGI